MLFEDKGKQTYLQIRVYQKEKDAIREVADKYDLTLTDLVKNAINEYVKVLEKQEKK